MISTTLPNLSAFLLVVFGLCSGFSAAANDEDRDVAATRLLTGKPLKEMLESRRSLSVAGQSLRDVLSELQGNTGIPICIDRRLNPSALIELNSGYVTTSEIVEGIARRVPNAAVSVGDQYLTIGPAIETLRLRTLAELRQRDVQSIRREMEADQFRALIEKRDQSWPKLSEPRQLLVDAAAAAEVEINNPEVVPHDLWAAAKLSALTFSDFATLILNQFDLTFKIDYGGVVTLTPVPEVVAIEKRHRVSPKNKKQIADRWSTAFPGLKVRWNGSTAVVSTNIETHERLKELIRGDSSGSVAAADLRSRLFTLKVRGATFERLIAYFRNEGVPIRIQGRAESELEAVLQRSAELNLTKSPSSEFFVKVFEGSGADVSVNDTEVVLTFP